MLGRHACLTLDMNVHDGGIYRAFSLSPWGLRQQRSWRPCWCNFQKNIFKILLSRYTNMAPMTSHANALYIQHLPFIKGKRVMNNVYGIFNSASVIAITPMKCQLCIMEVQYNTSVIHTGVGSSIVRCKVQ